MDPSQLPLRDWHSPAMVGWWPPAPGWWIVFVFGILLLAAVLWSWRRFTRPSVKKLAKRELERLRSDPDLSPSERVRRLSVLTRRICLSIYPRSQTARLTGKDWLRFLDTTLDEPGFFEGPGSVLIDAPYRRNAEVDCDPLFALYERWIESLPESARARSGSKRGKAA